MSTVESENVTRLTSETETAEDLKRRFAEALKPVLDLANEASEHRINVQLGFSRDMFGKLILEAKLIKEL
jgi:hypothetical protein